MTRQKRDARTPLLRRKTPAVTAGGGKREAVIRAAGGDERRSSGGPRGRVTCPRALLSHPRRPRATSLAYFLPSPSLDLLCNRVCVCVCVCVCVARARLLSFSPSRCFSAFERRVHLYSAPTPHLGILLHARLHECFVVAIMHRVPC